jgi:hypothetical protein
VKLKNTGFLATSQIKFSQFDEWIRSLHIQPGKSYKLAPSSSEAGWRGFAFGELANDGPQAAGADL